VNKTPENLAAIIENPNPTSTPRVHSPKAAVTPVVDLDDGFNVEMQI